jgi:hypothetical protein
MRNLVLSQLKQGLPGVTPALGEAHYEACLVCLHSQNHSSGAAFQVKGKFNETFALQWITQSRVQQKIQQVRAFNNPLPAYIAVVEFSRPLVQLVKI